MARKLPVGMQSFTDIRNNDYVYVDKTGMIYQLISTGKTYFLSRPRRFGKSLMLSTMEAYFSGKKELFKGLAIEELENNHPLNETGVPWTPSPVIRLDFNSGNYNSMKQLRIALNDMLRQYEKKWGKDEGTESLSGRFLNLIHVMYEKTGSKPVILIDEYDKPLIANIRRPELSEEIRNELKSFFGVLKTADEWTRFIFITGVTRFSHVSIFSDMNQPDDISMSEEFNTLCGLTYNEIESTFKPELEALGEKENLSLNETLGRLKYWYDGYLFSENGDGVFNPYSVLKALRWKKFDSYWFATGTPSFLIETVEDTDFDIRRMVDGIKAVKSDFMSYKANLDEPVPLFYQSGYLTIKKYDPELEEYTLSFPNREVKGGFINSILPIYTGKESDDTTFNYKRFVSDIKSGNVVGFIEKLKSLLASVPYPEGNLDTAAVYERTYHTAIYLIFILCGMDLRSEVHMSTGRIDAVLETEDTVYLFEFKTDRNDTAENALQQIDDKNYDLPYQQSGKDIKKIGILFSIAERTITDYSIA